MRKIASIAVAHEVLYAVCTDGTLWQLEDGWVNIDAPPDGPPQRKELTLEEVGNRLRQSGRGMIIGRGKQNETE